MGTTRRKAHVRRTAGGKVAQVREHQLKTRERKATVSGHKKAWRKSEFVNTFFPKNPSDVKAAERRLGRLQEIAPLVEKTKTKLGTLPTLQDKILTLLSSLGEFLGNPPKTLTEFREDRENVLRYTSRLFEIKSANQTLRDVFYNTGGNKELQGLVENVSGVVNALENIYSDVVAPWVYL